ncbi:hypothetical protein GCM10009865_47640 [Aeromicrobium ponti]|uniref:Uncharacterized protein n=1 Tax=Cytobacillus oceanisediminis TaxID=665099 RepID=A0A562JD22_9BACI|nr:hypothetical protein [Cytobacillus oceanisediminis]TWH80993.1 hypothetical protein IQ19_04410 [Cytobacillus oceanisediminis]
MYDTLLQRYGDMSFILSLPATVGINLYIKAVEKNSERQAWEQWLVAYQSMTKENFISFNDYLKQLKQPQQPRDNRTDDEIIQDAENILKSMKRSEN